MGTEIASYIDNKARTYVVCAIFIIIDLHNYNNNKEANGEKKKKNNTTTIPIHKFRKVSLRTVETRLTTMEELYG